LDIWIFRICTLIRLFIRIWEEATISTEDPPFQAELYGRVYKVGRFARRSLWIGLSFQK